MDVSLVCGDIKRQTIWWCWSFVAYGDITTYYYMTAMSTGGLSVSKLIEII